MSTALRHILLRRGVHRHVCLRGQRQVRHRGRKKRISPSAKVVSRHNFCPKLSTMSERQNIPVASHPSAAGKAQPRGDHRLIACDWKGAANNACRATLVKRATWTKAGRRRCNKKTRLPAFRAHGFAERLRHRLFESTNTHGDHARVDIDVAEDIDQERGLVWPRHAFHIASRPPVVALTMQAKRLSVNSVQPSKVAPNDRSRPPCRCFFAPLSRGHRA